VEPGLSMGLSPTNRCVVQLRHSEGEWTIAYTGIKVLHFQKLSRELLS